MYSVNERSIFMINITFPELVNKNNTRQSSGVIGIIMISDFSSYAGAFAATYAISSEADSRRSGNTRPWYI